MKLPDLEGGTVVTDPAGMPSKLAESPGFAALVKAGKLPPVEQRIGQDPLVIKPVDGIGKYGGEIRRGYVGVGDTQNGIRFCAGPDSLLYWDYEAKNVVPNIARGYELSRDGKVLTLQLRRGMRWSDGQPFTADDIAFWSEDINLNPDIVSPSSLFQIHGKPVKVRKLDDYTIEYVSPEPYPLLVSLLAGGDVGMAANGDFGGVAYAPKHYLQQFLPKYSSEAAVTRAAKARDFASWPAYLLNQTNWTVNKDLPMVTPWVMVHPINDSPWRFEANPYSVWVDTAGNQLPYIPKVTMRDAKNQQVITLRAVAGEYDFQDRNLLLASLPVLLKNQQRSGYTIYRAPQTELDCTIRINLAYVKDKTIGDLLRTADFRRALSLAIDRDTVNQTFFLGTAVPSAVMVADDSPYFPGKEWRTKWATLDVARANKLLDGIGLTDKDGSGYRIRPDGKGRIRLDYVANKTIADYPAIGEMIKGQWKAIGIDMFVETITGPIGAQRRLANEIVLQGIAGGTEDPILDSSNIIPHDDGVSPMARPYASWLASGGKKGTEPPEAVSALKDAWDDYEQALSTTSDQERIELGKKILMMHADQVWSIGVVGFGLTFYGLYYAKNNIGNVPRRMVNSIIKSETPANALPMTFYYK